MSTPAPDAVRLLVDLSACNAQADHFDQNRKVFLSSDYKKEQLRAESDPSPSIRHSHFVIRTFLGMPVIHEESIKACPELGRRVAGATKAPDCTFRIGGRRVFFAEAKKPAGCARREDLTRA